MTDQNHVCEQAGIVQQFGLELESPICDACGWKRTLANPQMAPRHMHSDAFYGMVGALSIGLQPYAAFDVTAVHVSLVTMLGNLLGYDAHLNESAKVLHPNLMTALVMPTATGKGSSHALARWAMSKIAPAFDKQVLTSVGSAEGLLRVIGTEITTSDPKTRETKTEFTGVTNTSALYVEEELTALLIRCQQQPVMSRFFTEAFDSGTLMSVVKAETLTCREPHLSCLGHLVPDDFADYALQRDLVTGGWLNRWDVHLCKAVSTEQPMTAPDEIDGLEDLALGIKAGLDRYFENGDTKFTLSDEAEEIRRETSAWVRDAYRVGAMQHLSVRFQTRMLKTAMIFSACDGQTLITDRHMVAARAYQAHALRSVAAFAQGAFFDARDELLLRWREADYADLSMTDLGDLFSRNMTATKRQRLVQQLERDQICTVTREKSGGGRPKTILSINEEALTGPVNDW